MWRNYLTTALRHLARNRLYAAISIASLAVGFAVAVLVGVFLRHELSYDRFLPDYGRLYVVRQVFLPPGQGPLWRYNDVRTDVAAGLRADFPQVEDVARLQHREVGIQQGADIATEPDFGWADPNLFQVLRLPFLAGDPATALTRPDGVVLTAAMARKYFGSEDVLGRALTVRPLTSAAMGGEAGAAIPLQVTGVLKDLPSETHLKIEIFGALVGPGREPEPPDSSVRAFTYVRLRPGASASKVRQALSDFAARRIPPDILNGGRLALELAPLSELHLPSVRIDNPGAINPTGDRTLLKVVGVIGLLILLAAAVNFIGLTTARASERAVEVGVRKTAGARRSHLVAQFLAEAGVQVGVAFLVALALAELLAPDLGHVLDRSMALDYGGDKAFLAALAAAAVFVGLAAGFYPAWVLSSFRPAAALKGAVAGDGGSARARQLLVIIQFAVLLILMSVIVTVWRQTRLVLDHAERSGVRQVLLVDGRPICGTALERRILALPGVRAGVCSSNTMLHNGGGESSAIDRAGHEISIVLGPVDPGFFEFYGLRPVAGRVFQAARPGDQPMAFDPDAVEPPVVLNEAAVRRLGFASPQAAVGQSVRWSRLSWRLGAEARYLPDRSQVLGVTPDYAGTSREAVKPMIFWVEPGLNLTLSLDVARGYEPQVAAAIDRLWKQAGRAHALDIRLLDQEVRIAYGDVLATGRVVSGCAVIALALAATGLFALAAYTTERRTKEFGVRKAMGASATDIARLLLWDFSKPVLIAAIVAAPVGWFAMRWWLQGFADRVALTPESFIAVTVVAVAIAWATVLAHTLRVARTRPVNALRYE
jgi:putative ABC transport system permease protein